MMKDLTLWQQQCQNQVFYVLLQNVSMFNNSSNPPITKFAMFIFTYNGTIKISDIIRNISWMNQAYQKYEHKTNFSTLLSQAQKLHQSITTSQLQQLQLLHRDKIQNEMKSGSGMDKNDNFQYRIQNSVKTEISYPNIESKKNLKFINQAAQEWPSWTTQNKNKPPQGHETMINSNRNQEIDGTRSVSNMSETTNDTQKRSTAKIHWKDKIMYAQRDKVPHPRPYSRYTLIRYQYLTIPERDVTIFFPEQTFYHCNYIKLSTWSQVKKILRNILSLNNRAKMPACIVPNKIALPQIQKIEQTKQYWQIMKPDPLMIREWQIVRPMRDDEIGYDTETITECNKSSLMIK